MAMRTATQLRRLGKPCRITSRSGSRSATCRKPGLKPVIDGVEATAWRRPRCSLALAELVSTYGEEAAARYAENLAARIRNGEFSVELSRQ